MDFEAIQWSYDEATGIGRLVLDRPEAMNSLSTQMTDDIVAGFEAFEELDDDAAGVEVRAVVVEGAGEKAFCAGADITEMNEFTPGVFSPREAFDVCEQYDAPVIAKIDGYCLGGGLELALSCDFRIASERSTIGLPEVTLGIIPGGGGTQRLLSLVGPSRTKELCMTGEHIDAKQASSDGILDYVYPVEQLDDQVDEFVEGIASNPPLSVRAIKDVVQTGQLIGPQEGSRYESRVVNSLRQTQDHEEAIEAYSEDREPNFQGQ